MRFLSNKQLFRLHGWLGLNVGLLLFVICFSGTVAVFSHEVDGLLDPRIRAAPQDRPYAWGAMYRSLREAFPEGEIGLVSARRSPRSAVLAYVEVPGGQTRKVYLNPYTGALQGHTSFFNVQRFFRSYHRRFFDGTRGILVVTAGAFVLLFSALSGFLFYKGWLKNLFTLRWRTSRRRRWSDVHKLTGVWTLVFALLIALTGVYYFAEVLAGLTGHGDLLYEAPPTLGRAELAPFGPSPERLPVDDYVTIAREVYPTLEVRRVFVPHRPTEPVSVSGQAEALFARDRASSVLLHPFSGAVVRVQRAEGLPPLLRLADVADPLHFGYFGGLVTKALWFVFGLALSFAILSGTYLWYIRSLPRSEKRRLLRARRRRAPAEKPAAPWPRLRAFWRRIPWMRGATASFVLVTAYLGFTAHAAYEDIRAYGPRHVSPLATVDTVQAGPWTVRLTCEAPCLPGTESRFTAHFIDAGVANYRAASLRAGDARAPLGGSAEAPAAAVTPSGAGLVLSVEAWDGTRHTARVAADAVRAAADRLPAASPPPRHVSPPMPDAPPGVWLFIAGFAVVTLAVMVGWFAFLLRATLARRGKASARPAQEPPGQRPPARKARPVSARLPTPGSS